MASKAKEEFEQFERRASLAEEQIKALIQRVDVLEKALAGTTPSASSGADLAEYQTGLLAKLKDLEAILEGEQRHAEHITKQRDEALGALAELKKENAANAYRIKILVRSLEEAEGGGKT